MKKGVLVEADVDEHRFQAWLEVLDLAFVNAAGNLPVAFALNGELLQTSALEHGDAPFEALAGDDYFFFVALFLKTEKTAYFV